MASPNLGQTDGLGLIETSLWMPGVRTAFLTGVHRTRRERCHIAARDHNRRSSGPIRSARTPPPTSWSSRRPTTVSCSALCSWSRSHRGTRRCGLLRVARSEDEMEKPSRGNGQSSAKISGVVHIPSAEEATKFVCIRGDKPASIADQIDRSRSAPPVGKACKCNRQRECGNDGKRHDQRTPHERRRALNESSQAAENTQRYAHPPGCQKANFARAKAVGEIRVEQTELDKFELCKIFTRN
jgi:hypothetical protein